MVKYVSYWTWIKKNVSYKLDLIKCVWKNESVDKQGGADIKAKYGFFQQYSIQMTQHCGKQKCILCNWM